jgi:nucleotide-binding universal stress UspA family protein
MRIHPEFRRFLAGTDGTPGGEEAVRQAARLARITDAELEIVHVAHAPRVGVGGTGAGMLHDAEARLSEAGALASREHLDAVLRVLVGEPAHQLANEALRTWSDVVCVGADAGLLRRQSLRGGVAAHVVHLGVRPTLVCRPGALGAADPRRILVAVDGSRSSQHAVELAAAIAVASGARLGLVHATRPGASGSAGAFDGARRIVGNLDVEERTADGPAGPVVAAVAAGWDADLVAVGDRGRNALGRVALGSVSDWLLRHLDRTVLVARSRTAA